MDSNRSIGNRSIDKYDLYDIACIIKETIEENVRLEQENERLRGIVEDYDKWVRNMNSQYQKNIGNILTTLINNGNKGDKDDEEI